MVPGTGLEPARPFERYHLKLVRVPVFNMGILGRLKKTTKLLKSHEI